MERAPHWNETSQDIPFDLAKRHSRLAKAYEILRLYIEAHEADKAKAGKNAAPEPEQQEFDNPAGNLH
jgi:hypothetical protein